ncbi:MAG: hypothetical protein J5I93_10340 [Pirellulaceae bacterium]|nr:hypothetical protein [Pirellulaceae bacterium]
MSVFTVVNTNDAGPGSLRQAINDANGLPGADSVRFSPGLAGTIALSSQLEVTDDVSIQGPSGGGIEVSGEGATRVLAVLPAGPGSAAPSVSIRNLTIANGLATDAPGYEGSPFETLFGWGGGIYNLGGSVSLDRVRLVGNQAAGFIAAGGGVANEFGGSLTVTRSQFVDNSSQGFGAATGGAIASDRGPTTGGGTVLIDQTSFVGNQAASVVGLGDVPALMVFSGAAGGGAIGNFAGQMTIFRSEFLGNQALAGGQAFGGAVVNSGLDLFGVDEATIHIRQSLFDQNVAIAGAGLGDDGALSVGGGFAALLGSEATLDRNVFRNNLAEGGPGGGTDGNGGNALGGGAGVLADTQLTTSANQLTNNVARGGSAAGSGLQGNGQGGGLGLGPWEDSGPIELLLPAGSSQRDVLVGNESVGLGGGIYNQGTLTVERAMVMNNLATGHAASEIVVSAAATIAGGGIGGGIANLGQLAVDHSRFSGNAARGADDVDVSSSMFPFTAFPGGAQGGGIANYAQATVNYSRFYDNVAEAGDRGNGDFATLGSGGAIYNDGSLQVDNGYFQGNQVLGGDDGVSPFHNGHALGGAISSGTLLPAVGVLASAELVVTRSTFDGNLALGGSRNVVTLPPGAVPPADGPNNAYGGAILVYQGSADLSRLEVRNNEAIGGDGGASQNGSLGVGGGIFLFDFLGGVTAQVDRVQLRENRAVGGDGVGPDDAGGSGIGGGMAIGSLGSPFAGPGAVSITNSYLNRNEAIGGTGSGSGAGGLGQGGGIANVAGANTLVERTSLYQNRAVGGNGGGSGDGGQGQGGGVYNQAGADLELVRDTVFRNWAAGGSAVAGTDGEGFGGGVFNEGGLLLDLTQVLLNQADFGDDFWPLV